jgi:hypothetical protein
LKLSAYAVLNLLVGTEFSKTITCSEIVFD